MKTVLALLLMTAPAVAGERWCNDGVPYDIERIENGFAVVRMYSEDRCVDDGAGRFICEDRDDYRLDFEAKGELLTLTYTDGNTAIFRRCS